MRSVKGWERGSVDEMGFVDFDAPESWGLWAERVSDPMPEATLCQRMALSVRGSFDGDDAPEGAEVSDNG